MEKFEIQYVNRVSVGNKIRRGIWNIVYMILFRPFCTKLFNPWRLALLKLFGADVKVDSHVYASAIIREPWNLKLGHKSCLAPHVNCYNLAMIELEDNVTVSQYSYLCTAGHNSSKLNSPHGSIIIAPILLKENSWIGSHVFIGMGVCIGERAIVGATASVFKSVEADSIVGGNPAKFIKKRGIIDL